MTSLSQTQFVWSFCQHVCLFKLKFHYANFPKISPWHVSWEWFEEVGDLTRGSRRHGLRYGEVSGFQTIMTGRDGLNNDCDKSSTSLFVYKKRGNQRRSWQEDTGIGGNQRRSWHGDWGKSATIVTRRHGDWGKSATSWTNRPCFYLSIFYGAI